VTVSEPVLLQREFRLPNFLEERSGYASPLTRLSRLRVRPISALSFSRFHPCTSAAPFPWSFSARAVSPRANFSPDIPANVSAALRWARERQMRVYLALLPASDNPNAFIFPRAANAKRTASLSNQFRDILVAAGLVEPRPRGHRSTGRGRSGAREPSELSFHSLRHSAVTMLKAAGVSDFIAREIVGHESAAVSRQYTHLTTDDKRAAMQRLPDVTDT
jgi:integrase